MNQQLYLDAGRYAEGVETVMLPIWMARNQCELRREK